MLDASFSPGFVGMEDQFRAAGFREVVAPGGQFGHERFPVVDPGVSGDPKAPVPIGDLRPTIGLCRRAKKRVAHANAARYPDFPAVRAAESQKIRHGFNPRGVDGRSIKVNDGGESAHGLIVLNPLLNDTKLKQLLRRFEENASREVLASSHFHAALKPSAWHKEVVREPPLRRTHQL